MKWPWHHPKPTERVARARRTYSIKDVLSAASGPCGLQVSSYENTAPGTWGETVMHARREGWLETEFVAATLVYRLTEAGREKLAEM